MIEVVGKIIYLEWGVEGKKEAVITTTEVSGNSIKVGFVSRANAL